MTNMPFFITGSYDWAIAADTGCGNPSWAIEHTRCMSSTAHVLVHHWVR